MTACQRIVSYTAAVVGAFVLAIAPLAAPASAQGAPVDVAVTLTLSDSTLYQGQPVTFTTLVENKLPGTASPVRVKLFVHRDFNVHVVSSPGFSCKVFPLETVCDGQVTNGSPAPIVIAGRAPHFAAELRATALHDNSSGDLNDVDKSNYMSRRALTIRD